MLQLLENMIIAYIVMTIRHDLDFGCINIETKITKRYNTIALPVLFSQIPKPNGICMRSLGMPEK